ncbi:MAG: CpaD family pilus assembly protein [Methylobacteriaceae bacterium]|nr:CpaD family pilus assembly protein [Methylobacteriaceae bacterium]MBV9220740.1 CpaD family pilus assembly protein [Methylobacteriaceae bacterium]MBV9245814.1 CpaD family pilus assembly protein [Methylobacteriaceae bacterium]MBV9636414.1 CpaD family pilus assembly protein [Methylobacteriaceae bacterium]MBV9703454.1 CpaD family pilus assembly protein [Methylobacteriaceae bacterium]
MPKMSAISSSKSAAGLARAGLLALMLPVAGCVTSGSDRIVATSVTPEDPRLRHPIALVEAPSSLDVFVAGPPGQLDIRTADQIREFAAVARQTELTPIAVLLPRGSRHDWLARAAVPAIRRALVEGGARGYVNVGTYPVFDPALAAPVRLTFEAVKAKVATQCGQWPRDLASGSSIDGWENRPYWNYGCAAQSNFAAQVADPRDLVEPRPETPSDVEMRMRAIGNVRKGTDPGTTWTIRNSNLGAAGG